MFVFYIVFCCIAKCYASKGRTVQCVIGRDVSFSFTFSNIHKDALVIFHGPKPFLRVLPISNKLFLHTQDERLHVNVNKTSYTTVTVNISITNVTENDGGIYKLIRNWNPEEVIDSVFVQAFATFPRIRMVPYNIADSTIVLQCTSASESTGKFFWKLNGSAIQSHNRYFQNSTHLAIENVSSDDIYNIYTCQDSGSGLVSDPFKLSTSGPKFVRFEGNVSVAKELEWLNISCLSDCYEICTWNWTKVDGSSAVMKTVSSDKNLQLKNITRDDAGTYVCKVHNIISDISLEGVTYLDVVYGPNKIGTNTSGNTVQLDGFETITILCYSDCFPPCQISWTETNTQTRIPGSKLMLMNVKNDVNYTCHVSNPRMSNATLSETIYIKVTNGTNHYMTTMMLPMIPMNPTEDFPATRHIFYVVLGVGVVSFIGLFICVLHKVKTCLDVRRTSNNTLVQYSNQDVVEETIEEEIFSGNYWTIVSNEEGEMTTAFENIVTQCNMTTAKGITKVQNQNSLELSESVIEESVDIQLDDYLDPITAGFQEHDDYIHPVHSIPLIADVSSKDQTAEI